MKKYKYILILVLLLSGCAAFDAPVFKPNQYNTDLYIKVIPTEDFTALAEKYNFKSLGGLTIYKDFKGRCELYIPIIKEVRDGYTMCVAGHELFHCILGSFHKPDEGATCKDQT